jgi:signal transduction histidine kinase
MLRSFRARLIAGFALVIALSLFLAAAGFTILLREQQAQAAEQRIGALVGPFSARLLALQLEGAPAEYIYADLRDLAIQFDVRVLVIDDSEMIVLDTSSSSELIGRRLTMPVVADDVDAMRSFYASRSHGTGEDLYLFTAATPGGAGNASALLPGGRVVIAVPATDVTSAWFELLPRLTLAGLSAGLVAVVVATLLAARITNPIAQMTRASERMAHGDLSQRVGGEGSDEIGMLASAFNQMSEQVSRSNRAMRDLLANVSHDLKTPLTSIRGFSQALVDGLARDGDEAREMAGAITDEAERMRHLVDDLLYLSEIESGSIALEFADTDIPNLLSETAGRFRYAAAERNVTVVVEGSDIVAPVDARRIEQAFTNLVDNALRFAPAGSDIVLRTSRAGDDVRVDVHNDGEPIPEDQIPMLFDRFYRTEQSRSGEKHTGLGLAIVRELTQAHGGNVSVTSSSDGGSTFTLVLPADGRRRAPAANRSADDQGHSS